MSDYDLKSSVTMTNQASPVLQKLQGDLDQTGRKFDGLGSQSSKLGIDMGALGGAAAAVGLSFSVAAVAGLGKAAIELGNVGAQSLRTEAVFRSLAGGADEAAQLLDNLRAASGNTASDMVLMQASMTPLIGVTAELRRAFIAADPTILALAKAISDATPQLGNATDLYASFSEGLRRGNPRMLESAGLVIDQKRVFDQYATSLGITATQLNDSQKTQALLNEVMRQSPDIIARIGTEADSAAEAGDRLATSFGRVKIAAAEALAPSTSGFQDLLTGALDAIALRLEGNSIAYYRAGIAGLEADIEKVSSGTLPKLAKAALIAWDNTMIDGYRVSLDKAIAELHNTATALTTTASKDDLYADATNRAATATQIFGGKAFTLSTMLAGLAARLNDTAAKARKASDAMAAGAVKSITGSLLGATGVVSLKDYTQNVGAAGTAVTVLTAALNNGAISQETYDYRIAQLSESNQTWVSDLNASANALDKVGGGVDDLTTKLTSLISAQLQPSFSLSALAPELATGEGNLDEHYRRLAAIALRGGEELTKHADDWKDTIALIPENVRAQGAGAMQAWATETVQAYDKGLDFSLIDRDALKARILAQLKAGEMRDAVIAELAAELGGSVSTAKLQEAASIAVGGNGGAQVSAGIKDSIDVTGTLTLTAAAINAGAKTFEKELKSAGGSVGGAILGGITEAVTGGAPDIIKRLAEALSKPVADILARDGRRTGD